MNSNPFYSLVWDITIGAGDMPEEAEPVYAEVEEDLERPLTPEERVLVKEAYRQCYQEFHQP